MEYLPTQGGKVPYRLSSRNPRERRPWRRIILGGCSMVPVLQPWMAPTQQVPYPCRHARAYQREPIRVPQVPRYQPPSPRKLSFPGGEGCSTYRGSAPSAAVQYRYMIHAARKECTSIHTRIVSREWLRTCAYLYHAVTLDGLSALLTGAWYR